MNKNIPNIFKMVERKHSIALTVGLVKCINKHAETEEEVIGFGRTIWQGFEYNTVYIMCGDGQTRQFFFDPETFDIREVEPRTGITAAKAIKGIREILESPVDNDTRIRQIVTVIGKVE